MATTDTSQAIACASLHRESQDAIHRIADVHSERQFNWKPAVSAWSVAECIVHLNLVASAYLPRFEAAVEDGAPRARGPVSYGFFARRMMLGVQPGGPPLTTSASLDPNRRTTASTFDRAETLRQFDEHVRRYIAVCERADGLDLARIKVRYPFFPLLRLPLGAFLEITAQHALRHVAQAERVAQASGFPR